MEDKTYVLVRVAKDQENAVEFSFRIPIRPEGLIVNLFSVPLDDTDIRTLKQGEDGLGYQLVSAISEEVSGVERIRLERYGFQIGYGRAFDRHQLVVAVLKIYMRLIGVDSLEAYYPPKLQPVRIDEVA